MNSVNTILSSLLLLIFHVSVLASAAIACEPGWTSTAYGCYKIMTIRESFGDARTKCQTLGGDLVHLQSQAEQDSITDLLPLVEDYWIGLKKGTTQFVWVSTGVETSWTAWPPGFPMFFFTPTCAALHFNLLFWWGNTFCSTVLSYICEMDSLTTEAKTTTPEMMVLTTDVGTAAADLLTPVVLTAVPTTSTTVIKGREAMFMRENYSDDVGTDAVHASSILMCAVFCCRQYCQAFTFDDINKKCAISEVMSSSMEFKAVMYHRPTKK